MFSYIKAIVSSKVFKPLLQRITNYFTQGATPAARAYADKAAQEVADSIPETLEMVGKAYAAYKLATLAENTMALSAVAIGETSKEKKALFSPAKVYHDYKNYQYLNGVVDGGYTSREEDDFVILDKKPTLAA